MEVDGIILKMDKETRSTDRTDPFISWVCVGGKSTHDLWLAFIISSEGKLNRCDNVLVGCRPRPHVLVATAAAIRLVAA